MTIRVKEVIEAFELLFDGLHDRDFRKTLSLTKYRERDLNPLVRTFLLGYFGAVSPEVRSALPGSLTGEGSIDYVIGDVAVEFAVRRPHDARLNLSAVTNATEVKKLTKWRGKSLLVLFDFSRDPFERVDLERYREWPSLGKGSHKKNAFTVAYFNRGTSSSPKLALEKLLIRP